MDLHLPYEIAKLATGPVRVVYAKASELVTAPTKIQDLIYMTEADDYAVKTNVKNLGAMVNPTGYSTGNTQNNLGLQNETLPVETEVTEVARSINSNLAEIDRDGLTLIEGADADDLETIAAAVKAGAQKALEFGGYDELEKYRVAFIGRRKKSAGLVLEGAGDATPRGRFFACLLYYASITGDAKSITFDRSGYANADVAFNAYDDPVVGKHGRWLFEDAGTIALV